jgi:predicted ATPase
LLLFSVLYSFWAANILAFNGDVVRQLATQFLALAEEQGALALFMTAHRIMGISLVSMGDIADGRAHLDRALALYDPATHRPLATRFGLDAEIASLSYRSQALWLLGYPDAALRDANDAREKAHQTSQAAALMIALNITSPVYCGNYAAAKAQADELIALAGKKGALFWKAAGMMQRGVVLALTGKASNAVQTITAAIAARRSSGSTLGMPWQLSCLARAYAELGQFDDAHRCIREAMTAVETTKEKWCEAEVNRVAGEITLMSPDTAKAGAYFERAFAVARHQQAKSWELRASISLARLWRDQGKVQQARELLAPVYGWFTEGFDTLDLKEAKALLEELAA